MSTHVTGYRVRDGVDVWQLVERIRRRALVECRSRLRCAIAEQLAAWRRDPARLDAAMAADPKLRGDGPNPVSVSRWIERRWLAQIGTSQRNDFDLDVTIAVHRAGGPRACYLLRTFDGSGYFDGVLDFVPRLRSLTEYHWQDATDDLPRGVTASAYARRKRVWLAAFGGTWSPDHGMVVDIVSPGGWRRIDPGWEMLDEERAPPATAHPSPPPTPPASPRRR